MKRVFSFSMIIPLLLIVLLPSSLLVPSVKAAISICPGAPFALTGDQEVPPTTTTGTASAAIGYNISTNTISWNITYTGLQGSVNGAHIHRGLPGENGSVEVNIGDISGLSSPIIGSAVLTAGQEADLLEGKLYINIHTVTNPGGEVRGQIPVPTFPLSGTQEVPPTGSTADGTAIIFFDFPSKILSWSINYSGLQGTITAAHFHNAPVEVNGPVVIDIGSISGLTSPMTGSTTLTDAQVLALKTSKLYVNIHSTAFPGGEIRTQINGCSLPNVINLPWVKN